MRTSGINGKILGSRRGDLEPKTFARAKKGKNKREKVLRAQGFWAVGHPATTQNLPIYLTSVHSELSRKPSADALVCVGIPGLG